MQAGASELAKDGAVAFHLKIDGHKHSFEASTAPERNGWFVAFEKAIEEAKAKETEIVESEGYKEQLEKLSKFPALCDAVVKKTKHCSILPAAASLTTSAEKPAPFVPAATASSSAPKKSTDLDNAKPAEATEAGPARAGSSSSSSSSSSDEEKKKKKKNKSKSRSVSRGKRTSFFGGLLNKKDKVEDKAEEKKDKVEDKAAEKKEEKTEDKKDEPVVAPATEGMLLIVKFLSSF